MCGGVLDACSIDGRKEMGDAMKESADLFDKRDGKHRRSFMTGASPVLWKMRIHTRHASAPSRPVIQASMTSARNALSRTASTAANSP
jgi:hypothetical protein